MHIAYLTSEYPHSEVSRSAGIGSFIKNLAQSLVKRGHRVTVFVYGQKENGILEDQGVHLHLLAHKSYRLGGFLWYRKLVAHYINRVSRAEGIDLIEAPEWTGITAFMRLNVPLILRLHGSDTYFCHLENRPQKKKNYFFEKRALQTANQIISVSSFTAQKTKEIFSLNRKITVIQNFISTENFTPSENEHDKLQILNFGTIIRKKGVIALAKAFNTVCHHLPAATLSYLGTDVKDVFTGKMTTTLIKEQLSDRARSRVFFLDPVPYHQVQAIIKEASVIALPSYAEAFPMTWLEAMALQKPMVTSDIGWASEIMVHGTTGFCIPPDSTKALPSAILHLLTNKKQAKEMGIKARQHIKDNFDEKIIVQRNIDFYTSLLSR